MQNIRIALDVDGVLADFSHQIIDHARKLGLADEFPRNPSEVNTWDMCPRFREVFNSVCFKDSFWDSVPSLGNLPDFKPIAYVTARPISSSVTEKWLVEHRYPRAEVITVSHPDEKLAVLERLKTDVFIDDYYDTIRKINRQSDTMGLLFKAPYQRGHEEEIKDLPIIDNLRYDDIVDKFQRHVFTQ